METPACLPLPAPLVARVSFGLVLPPLAFLPPRGARPAGGRGGIFAKREPLVVVVLGRLGTVKVGVSPRRLPGGPTADAIVVPNIGGIAAATMPPDQLIKPSGRNRLPRLIAERLSLREGVPLCWLLLKSHRPARQTHSGGGLYDYALVNNRPDAAPRSGAAPPRGKTHMAIPYAMARSDGMPVCVNVSGLDDALSER